MYSYRYKFCYSYFFSFRDRTFTPRCLRTLSLESWQAQVLIVPFLPHSLFFFFWSILSELSFRPTGPGLFGEWRQNSINTGGGGPGRTVANRAPEVGVMHVGDPSQGRWCNLSSLLPVNLLSGHLTWSYVPSQKNIFIFIFNIIFFTFL